MRLKNLVGKKIYDKMKPLRSFVLSKRRALVRQFVKSFGKVGLNVYPTNNYYSPLPSPTQLKKNRQRWMKPSTLAGVNYSMDEIKALFIHLQQYMPEYMRLPSYESAREIGFGPGYTYLDSITSYMMIRDIKPKTYLEIGSGLSTYYASLALNKNIEVDDQTSQIICVEPYAYSKLKEIKNISLLECEVQDVSMDQFNVLEENDILFIDSTHIVKIDGDVPYIYLEILPRLKKGVFVQIHDIPFPYNIPFPPDLWIFKQGFAMYWTEAMLLQALLCNSDTFEIVLSTPLIRHFDEQLLKKYINNYKGLELEPNTFSSIWLKKIK